MGDEVDDGIDFVLVGWGGYPRVGPGGVAVFLFFGDCLDLCEFFFVDFDAVFLLLAEDLVDGCLYVFVGHFGGWVEAHVFSFFGEELAVPDFFHNLVHVFLGFDGGVVLHED